jgi:chemotaxis-related protein WspD
MINIRGELHLCVRLDLLLGVSRTEEEDRNDSARLIVIRRESEGWVFAADEVDQVHRWPLGDLVSTAPTLSRALSRLSRGVFSNRGRSIGLLDDPRLFQVLRERTR